MVLPRKPEKREEAYERTPTDGKVGVVEVCELVSCASFPSGLVFVTSPVSSPPPQVFLDAHPQTGDSIKMITDEVSQIQEVSRTSS